MGLRHIHQKQAVALYRLALHQRRNRLLITVPTLMVFRLIRYKKFVKFPRDALVLAFFLKFREQCFRVSICIEIPVHTVRNQENILHMFEHPVAPRIRDIKQFPLHHT